MGALRLPFILGQLHGCTRSDKNPRQYYACCPAHKGGKEQNQSFGILLDDDGSIKLNCFAGCTKEAILAALGITFVDLSPDDCDSGEAKKHKPKLHDPEKKKKPKPELAEWNKSYAAFFLSSERARSDLAKHLDLPESVFAKFPDLGAIKEDQKYGSCWTHPERDGDGNIVGIFVRTYSGEKRNIDGSERGLTIPDGWELSPGPLYFVEGLSDVIAMAAAGLPAIGRPGATAGDSLVVDFIARVVPTRELIWIGENDRQPDGNWPGRDGSRRSCDHVSQRADRAIRFVMTPDGLKDPRVWLTKAVKDGAEWKEAGTKFAAALKELTDQRPDVRLDTTNRQEINDRVIPHVVKDPDLYSRANAIVRIWNCDAHEIRRGKPDEDGKKPIIVSFPPAPRIVEVKAAVLGEYVTKNVNFIATRNKKTVDAGMPDWMPETLRGRGRWEGMRPLEAIVDHPIIRPDGSLITKPGYDEATGVFYCLGMGDREPVVNLRATREDARAAWRLLSELVVDFPFQTPAVHRAAWLAGFLTPLVRFAFNGPTPLFLVDGNHAGTGKGLLCDTIGIPLTGRPFATTAYTHLDEEMRKRITALAMEGDPLVLLDNINGNFGGSSIDRVLTSTRWKDRVLGKTEQVEAALWAIWYGTGNNVEFVCDILRRICLIRLESKTAKPEERNDFRHPDLRGWAARNRSKLLGHALTILTAYFHAGAPEDSSLKTWGSYENWSRIVRQAIVWLDLPDELTDPYEMRAKIQSTANVKDGAIKTIVTSWELLGGKPMTCSEIIAKVFTPGGTPDHLQAVADAIDTLSPNRAPNVLGMKFRAHRTTRYECKGRERYLLEDETRGHTNAWNVFDSKTGESIKRSLEGTFENIETTPPRSGNNSSTSSSSLFGGDRSQKSQKSPDQNDGDTNFLGDLDY
jgi:hypothetical protein